MRKEFKILSVVLSVIFLMIALAAFAPLQMMDLDFYLRQNFVDKVLNDRLDDVHIHFGSMEHPKKSTNYTESEQIERVAKRTEERFQEEITTGEIVNYYVEILYSFDNESEYFLVQLEFAQSHNLNEDSWYQNYAYIIGFFCEDNLFIGLNDYKHFNRGVNPYWFTHHSLHKKYYGANGTHAVKEDGQIIGLYCSTIDLDKKFDRENYVWEQEIIDPSQYKDLSKVCVRSPKDY